MQEENVLIERGCGTRKVGGIYGEVLSSPYGQPIEYFLFCPPYLVDPEAIGLAPIGVKLIERNEVFHVMDWVGETYYPNVADFVEEGRRFGISRRMEGIDYTSLSPLSRLILVHRRVWVSNHAAYYDQEHVRVYGGENYPWTFCPKSQHKMEYRLSDMCLGIAWDDVREVEQGLAYYREGLRTMPSFTYAAALPPVSMISLEAPGYKPAIFGSFPLHRLVVIRDPECGTHEDAYQKAKVAGIPVEVVDA